MEQSPPIDDKISTLSTLLYVVKITDTVQYIRSWCSFRLFPTVTSYNTIQYNTTVYVYYTESDIYGSADDSKQIHSPFYLFSN